MNIKFVFLVLGMVAGLTACSINTQPTKAARDNGGGIGKASDPTTKPDPITTPAKVNEKMKVLQLQKPTQIEDEFLNVMDLDVTGAERALFSFSYAPDDSGTLFFTLAQARLHLQGCTKAPDRTYSARIFWQQVVGDKRVIVKEFTPNVDTFDFKKGQSYILSYALMDLKEFSDCKSATLKFASFLKNYK